MIFRRIAIFSVLFFAAQTSTAAPSINKMQGCQGLIDFIDFKLNPAPAKYDVNDVKKVRAALTDYDQYIQKEIVTPGLLAFNGGDKAKADAMQKQVDAYKKSIVDAHKKRYPQKRLFMDQLVALNGCTKEAVPAGKSLNDLKAAFELMVKMVKQG